MIQVANKIRTLKGLHKAVNEPIGDLVTYRVMATDKAPMNQLDPFILLNHHGFQHIFLKYWI